MDAELLWIKSAQTSLKGQTSFCLLEKELRLYEENGVFRAKGSRFSRSDLPDDTANLVLLPRNHGFVELIVFECYEYFNHSGVSSKLAQARTCFWVPRGRSYDSPMVSDLPENRAKQAPPFFWVGDRETVKKRVTRQRVALQDT